MITPTSQISSGFFDKGGKDHDGTVVVVFGIKVDTNFFTAPFSNNKFYKEYEFTKAALRNQSMTLVKIKIMIGFLSFCANMLYLSSVLMQFFKIL